MNAPERGPVATLAGALELPLAEYAEQLLLGSGLDVTDALRLARSEVDAAPELRGLAEALLAGRRLAEDAT